MFDYVAAWIRITDFEGNEPTTAATRHANDLVVELLGIYAMPNMNTGDLEYSALVEAWGANPGNVEMDNSYTYWFLDGVESEDVIELEDTGLGSWSPRHPLREAAQFYVSPTGCLPNPDRNEDMGSTPGPGSVGADAIAEMIEVKKEEKRLEALRQEEAVGGLEASIPKGEIGTFAHFEFPLPGPSTTSRPLYIEEGPYEIETLTARIDDQAVTVEQVEAFLRTVPAQHGWTMRERYREPEGHSGGVYWDFEGPDDRLVQIQLYDHPDPIVSMSVNLIVTSTYADGG